MIGYDVTQPCDLHEMAGCSICSGLDKKLKQEESELTWNELTGVGQAERIAPGIVKARYAGKCGHCGADYPEGTPIRFSKSADGWTPASNECC